MLIYRVARAVLRWVVLPAQMRLRVFHAERCPASGPLIIVGNHLGLIDPVVIGCYVRRPIRILAKAEVFSWPILGWLARWTGVVPVRRGESDRAAVRTLAAILAQGDCIQLMPEGTYPKVPLPPAMLPAKTGAAFLALHTHAQVLPVALTGTERVWAPSRGWRVWHRPRVTLTFGEPFRPVAPANLPPKQAYQAVADEMSRHVAVLLPAAYRGYYADLAADLADAGADAPAPVAGDPQPRAAATPAPTATDATGLATTNGEPARSDADAGPAHPQRAGQQADLEG